MVTLSPLQTMDFTASVTYTDGQSGGPGLEFGLLANTSTATTFGVNYTPNAHIAMGVNYGRDDFSATRSRATPTRHPTRPGPIRTATGRWTTTRR